jgi:c-di-GMP-binding flagellar brake protein YcgR
VPIRATDNANIKLWRIAEHVPLNEEPKDIFKLEATLRDLSVGGMGVVFQDRPLLVADQRMRIVLKLEDSKQLLLEARSGPIRQSGETFEAGLHFRDLQASLEGRQMLTELTRIVHGMQLREAKRNRGKTG